MQGRVERLLSINGKRTVDSFHRELGQLMWDHCGMARNEAGLRKALDRIPELREEFWQNVKVPGQNEELNQTLERAGRVADFFELAELMCIDALHRNESCGGHFREEYQTPTARPSATTSTSPTSRPGSSPATASRPCCTRSRSPSTTSTPAQRSYK